MSLLRKVPTYWICQLCGWGVVGGMMLFFAHTYQVSISTNVLLARIAIVMVTGILTTHLLRLFIKWRGWLMQSIERVIPRLTLAMVLTSLVFTLIVLGAIEFLQLGVTGGKKLPFLTRLAGYTVDNGLYIMPWVLIYYFYHFIEKSRKQQLDTLQLESMVKELELKTIKSHINPHFIFNALNSIRALIDENPSRARTAITELSNILRSSMQAEKQETVTLERELNIVRDYLALEHIRFEDRLRIEYDIDEDTLDQHVPPMMLQTLVENAIKHGISKQLSGGKVIVISDFKDNHHELVVRNTGRLNGSFNGDGFGLTSTQNRLQLLFGDRARFSIREIDGDMVEAIVELPVLLGSL
jgi:two-component system, LytTR family, sensor kinase